MKLRSASNHDGDGSDDDGNQESSTHTHQTHNVHTHIPGFTTIHGHTTFSGGGRTHITHTSRWEQNFDEEQSGKSGNFTPPIPFRPLVDPLKKNEPKTGERQEMKSKSNCCLYMYTTNTSVCVCVGMRGPWPFLLE